MNRRRILLMNLLNRHQRFDSDARHLTLKDTDQQLNRERCLVYILYKYMLVILSTTFFWLAHLNKYDVCCNICGLSQQGYIINSVLLLISNKCLALLINDKCELYILSCKMPWHHNNGSYLAEFFQITILVFILKNELWAKSIPKVAVLCSIL